MYIYARIFSEFSCSSFVFFGPGVLTETTPPLPQLKTYEKRKEDDGGVDQAGGLYRLARVIYTIHYTYWFGWVGIDRLYRI